MARFPSNGGSFQVLSSESISENFRRLYQQAKQEGSAVAFMSATRQIGQRLATDPVEFGEPLYRLAALRMQVRQGAIGPLLIYFGGCEDRQVVFIKGAKLLPHQEK
jgi:hypothetical protein